APSMTPEQRRIAALEKENLRLNRKLAIAQDCLELQKKALSMLDRMNNGSDVCTLCSNSVLPGCHSLERVLSSDLIAARSMHTGIVPLMMKHHAVAARMPYSLAP
ncbi:MAG: hypothetical protein QQN46_09260, partial [Nitrosopumilus sp.]